MPYFAFKGDAPSPTMAIISTSLAISTTIAHRSIGMERERGKTGAIYATDTVHQSAVTNSLADDSAVIGVIDYSEEILG